MIDYALLAELSARDAQPVLGFIGALIGAGAGLIGGILNRNSAKKQQKEAQDFAKENSITDLVKLRDMAKKAGFNPLTALQAGAGTPAASNYQQQFNPALSSGGFIAESIQRGVDTYFNDVAAKDAQAETIRREAEDKRRWEAEMEQRGSLQRFGYSLTQQSAYSPPERVSFGKVGPSATGPLPTSPSDEGVSPSSIPLTYGGKAFKPSGQFSDAEAAESRYGEIAGEILGMSSFTHDLGRHARTVFNGRVMTTQGNPDFVKHYQKPKQYDRGQFGPKFPDEYRSPYGKSGPNRSSL